VVDTQDELFAIERIGEEKGIYQKVLLRITPGIDPHTHAAISTGKVDSKFGTAIETGQAMEITKVALSLPHIALAGFHCHIGSQIFDVTPFCDAAKIMVSFIADVKSETGYTPMYLNLGGGFGVRYTHDDPVISYREMIETISVALKGYCAEAEIEMPCILMEPGRSMVADSGMTLYTVGSIKEITGYKNYVAVDGGMTDNPRYALYGSRYTIYTANRMGGTPDYTCTIAGRCCESGDMIAEGVSIVRPQRGDIIAVAVTGAYNYSMASNYNRVPRPPIVMLGDTDQLVVRRETYEDVARLDV
jgi:diaminopimelate decarboxylase